MDWRQRRRKDRLRHEQNKKLTSKERRKAKAKKIEVDAAYEAALRPRSYQHRPKVKCKSSHCQEMISHHRTYCTPECGATHRANRKEMRARMVAMYREMIENGTYELVDGWEVAGQMIHAAKPHGSGGMVFDAKDHQRSGEWAERVLRQNGRS
jgi:anti-sigma28 factor (negative regulator of flagellin synthesis)